MILQNSQASAVENNPIFSKIAVVKVLTLSGFSIATSENGDYIWLKSITAPYPIHPS